MRNRTLWLPGIWLLTLSLSAPALWAQEQAPPEPLHTWMHVQQQRMASVDSLHMEALSTLIMDSPRGVYRLVIRTTNRARRDSIEQPRFRWQSATLEVTAPRRRTLPEDHLRRIPEWILTHRLLHQFTLPLPVLAALRQDSRLLPDTLEGLPVWRMELMPREHPPVPVQRLTAWFTRGEQPRLLLLRLLFHPRPPFQQITGVFRYRRSGELDVLSHFTIESIRTRRRRMRTYTVITTATTEITRLRLFHR